MKSTTPEPETLRRLSTDQGHSDPRFNELLREAARAPLMTPRKTRPRWSEGSQLLGGRFTVRQFLGQGGMGVVYEADDRERRTRVALKALPYVDAAGIYRLKQEFRSLAGVCHPNLVRLHELFCDGGEWFFTMELVMGGAWLEYLGATTNQLSRQRVLGELATGIHAIHQAGKLHGDLKPTNVMVTREHRVVILDFGLASDQESHAVGRMPAEIIGGTPCYMAPEQGAGYPSSCASDWYAFGVMLFEVLTGELPFQGTLRTVLEQKRQQDAPRASTLRPEIPQDQDQLCAALLQRRPEARPGYEEIMRVLGEVPPVSEVQNRSRSLFVGRATELRVMEEALQVAEQGKTAVLFVHGPSGIGKSALVEEFLERLKDRPRVVLFTGRCHERESLPYKACDSLIDALSRHLSTLPQERTFGLLPGQVHALARLFPAIDRLPAVRAFQPQHVLPPDPTALQREAFEALKELLSNLAKEALPVLFVDDLQWGDVDGANLLSFVLSPPEPPPLLFIGAHRSGETGDGLKTLSSNIAMLKGTKVQEIALAALNAEESEVLARGILPESRSGESHTIAVEAEGSPFFVTELARHAALVEASGCRVTLDGLIRNRVAQLPVEERRLIEALSVATGPAAADHLGAVIGFDETLSGIERLEGAALLRRTSGPQRKVIFYHDRIRETVLSFMDAVSLRQWHARWAETLATSPTPDVDALATHFAGAGRTKEALHFTELAADRAMSGLAFDYAASLYQRALDLLPANAPSKGALFAKLGLALADAGRSRESAHALVHAADGQPASARIDLQMRAAEQALMGGDFDLGMSLLGETLPHYGLRLPKRGAGVLMGILGARLKLALVRRKPVEFDAPVSPIEDRRIEICSELGYLLYFFDPPLGFYYISLASACRLRSCKRSHRLAGLAMLAIDRANFHPEESEAIEGLLEQAITLARAHADAPDLAFTLIQAGLAWTNMVKPLSAADISVEALELLRRHCTGAFAVWGSQMAQRTLASILVHGGYFARQRKALDEARTENLRHRSLFQERFLDVMEITTKLAEDDPEGAERIAAGCWKKVTPGRFSFFDVYTVGAQALLDLYQDRPEAAHLCMEGHMSEIRRTGLLRSKTRHFEVLFWRGTAAVAAWLESAKRPTAAKAHHRAFRVARSSIRTLNRLDFGPARAVAQCLSGILALRAGDRSTSARLLRESITIFNTHQMPNSVAGVRRCLGILLGGGEGRAMVDEADAEMRSLGVRNPARLTAMWLPGFGDL
jgi:serine/threonine protein kinase